jgi:hypothetical protein
MTGMVPITTRPRLRTRKLPPPAEVLPAPGAPFLQVRALRAQRGVAAVPGADPGRVGFNRGQSLSEDLAAIISQAREK